MTSSTRRAPDDTLQAARLTTPDAVSAPGSAKLLLLAYRPGVELHDPTRPKPARARRVPPLNIDLVRIAVAVYAADRSTYRSRRGSDWNQRDLDLEVPVSNAAAWTAVAGHLTSVGGFLTGDRWSLKLQATRSPRRPRLRQPTRPATDPPKRVVLLSGGAEGAIGALVSRSDLAKDERHVLVSHVSFTPVAPVQRMVASAIERLIPGPQQQHLQLRLSRNARRIDGSKATQQSPAAAPARCCSWHSEWRLPRSTGRRSGSPRMARLAQTRHSDLTPLDPLDPHDPSRVSGWTC